MSAGKSIRYKTPEDRARHLEEQKRYQLRYPDRWREIVNRSRKKGYNSRSGKRRAEREPEKAKARKIATNAIASGKLIRPDSCSRCHVTGKPDAHHADYAKPLEVTWLCRKCHLATHAEREP